MGLRAIRALRFVVRRLSDRGFLFTAATRPQQNSASALFEDLAASSVNHARIDLTPLAVLDTQELAEHIPGHAVSQRAATRLTEATQGSSAAQRAPRAAARHLRPRHSTRRLGHTQHRSCPLAPAISAASEGADDSMRTAAEFVAVLRDPLPAPVVGPIAARLPLRRRRPASPCWAG
ncbi:hypothetical protein ACPPVW_01475 [Leifsonia sp. McL0607]|uniref:hypothetical protein n=1 Tax=Leifsonia sp. McL0607 TaxID=3415672 RepID=UPI003CFAE575